MRADADFEEFHFIFFRSLIFFLGGGFLGGKRASFRFLKYFGDVESDGASWPRGLFRNFAVVRGLRRKKKVLGRN